MMQFVAFFNSFQIFQKLYVRRGSAREREQGLITALLFHYTNTLMMSSTNTLNPYHRFMQYVKKFIFYFRRDFIEDWRII